MKRLLTLSSILAFTAIAGVASAGIAALTATLTPITTGDIGSGTATFTVDEKSGQIIGTIEFTGVGSPPTGAQIVDSDGGQLIGFPPQATPVTTGQIDASDTLPQGNISAVVSGNAVLIIPTQNRPQGEISGVLVAQLTHLEGGVDSGDQSSSGGSSGIFVPTPEAGPDASTEKPSSSGGSGGCMEGGGRPGDRLPLGALAISLASAFAIVSLRRRKR